MQKHGNRGKKIKNIPPIQIFSDPPPCLKSRKGSQTASEITASEITAGEIIAGEITASEITASEITAGEITASEITAGEIIAGEITASEITASEITASEITASEITASEITASEITAGEITADEITASEITADEIIAGEIWKSGLFSVFFKKTGGGEVFAAKKMRRKKITETGKTAQSRQIPTQANPHPGKSSPRQIPKEKGGERDRKINTEGLMGQSAQNYQQVFMKRVFSA